MIRRGFCILKATHVSQKFERLLDTHRRPDGSRWTGQQLDEATGGIVPRSYVTNLRKGRIENPGYEKMLAIAKAMGFPPGAWFDEIPAGAIGVVADEEAEPRRVEHLFDAVRNPHTGESYANAEVARMTLGDLSEDAVEGIRIGAYKKVRPRSPRPSREGQEGVRKVFGS